MNFLVNLKAHVNTIIVNASKVEIGIEHIIFKNEKDDIVAFFDKTIIRSVCENKSIQVNKIN